MKEALFSKMIAFLQRLDDAKIAYHVQHGCYDSIRVTLNVPGTRWEVDFMEDGDVYVERFVSDGEILEESVLEDVIAKNSSDAPAAVEVAVTQP